MKGQIYKRYRSFYYAFKGLKHMLKLQPNFLIHTAVAAAAVACGVIFEISSLEWVAVVIVIGFVLVMEVLNTVVEYLVDFVCQELDPVAGKIKDIAAAAVLIAAITSVVVGLVIFVPKFS